MTTQTRLLVPLFGLALACSSADDSMASDPTEGSGDEPDVCDQYIECLSVVAPDEAEFQQTVIDECFAQPSDSDDICREACQVGLDFYRGEYPMEPACGGVAPECLTDADCSDPAAPSCYADLSCGPACGNGRLDAGEQCDPAALEACSGACELLEHDCSPIDNTGCAADTKCTLGIDMQNTELIYLTCAPDFIGPGGVQDACMLQSECSLAAPLCKAVGQCNGSCCVPYCYLGETSLELDCPGGLSCVPFAEGHVFSGNTWKPGTELFGVCI